MSKKPKYHTEKDSPFFRLRSKAKLANLLYSSKEKILRLTEGQDRYSSFSKPKKNGGLRFICAPKTDLKQVQSRIADLLMRIQPPEFLFAPVAGLSYVDNAARHLGSRSIRLLDIEDFFPSCTANRVVWFFRKRMECSPDVTAILRGIVTKDNCLPQGSPCSPILAYLCYIDMWEEIDRLVAGASCKLSVYADDLTISGKTVPESLAWEIKRTLYKFGHRYNVEKERSIVDRRAEITGVILARDSLHLPNRQHQKLFLVREELKIARSPKQREKLSRAIQGRESQARQVQFYGGKLSVTFG